MLEKLKAIEQRLTEVEQQLSDPAVYGERERLTALSREQKELTPVVACYRAYLRAQDTAREAEEMLSDPELRALAMSTVDGMAARRRKDDNEVCRAVRSAVSSYLYKHTKRSPMIIPMVTKL